jgi:F-type H+-transporting ATPase subunit b
MRAPLLTGLALALSTPGALAAQPHAVETVEHEEEEASQGHDDDGHGDAHGAHGDAHGGHDAEINWAHGFVGEKDGVEPDLLWRPVGTPPPALANIINAGLLFFILFKFGKAPVAEGLRKRKARIVAGMNEASKMRREAQDSLEKYEEKLRHIDQEIERVRREMRESAEAERARILSEAKERRARMERDARVLIEQEMKAAREALMRETVRSAVKSATEMLEKQVTSQDHERLATEYVDLVSKTGVNAIGGRA